MNALLRVWGQIPVLIRAVVGGYILVQFGSLVTVLPVLGNLKFHPEIPWALPAVILICWGYWKYFSGQGWPVGSKDARRRMSRTDTAIVHIGPRLSMMLFFGLIFILSYRLIMPSLFAMPPQNLSINPADFPLPTAIGFIISVAMGAALVEEIALRGYTQRLMEDRYGLLPAIALVSFLFWYIHFNHEFMTFRHIPFYIIASTITCFVAFVSRSLIPVIIWHFVADMILLPIYAFRPAFTEALLSAQPVWVAGATPSFYVAALMCVIAGVITGYLMWSLARDHLGTKPECAKPE